MTLSPIPDLFAGWLLAILGTYAMVAWNVPAIVLEAAMLRPILAISWKRAFWNAFVMNLATTILGVVVCVIVNYKLDDLYLWISDRVGIEGAYFVDVNFTIYFGVLYVISLVVSTLVEGGVLVNLESEIPKLRLWLTSLGVNALSYAICPLIFGVLLPSSLHMHP